MFALEAAEEAICRTYWDQSYQSGRIEEEHMDCDDSGHVEDDDEASSDAIDADAGPWSRSQLLLVALF